MMQAHIAALALIDVSLEVFACLLAPSIRGIVELQHQPIAGNVTTLEFSSVGDDRWFDVEFLTMLLQPV